MCKVMRQEELINVFKYIVKKCDMLINNNDYEADAYTQDTVEDIAELCNHILDRDYVKLVEEKEEPVSKELEDATQTITCKVYTRCYKDKLDAFSCKYPMSVPKPSKRYAKYSDVDLTIAVKEGAQWKEKNILKPADGEDLPEYDRGVIVLTQPYPLEGSEFAVSFAHRPNPKGWDGKSLISGKIEHYTPKTYDKGGWNIPDVIFWLDFDFSKSM